MILRMLELVDYIHLASQDAHINDIKIPPVHLFCTVVSLMDHGGGLEPLPAGYTLDIHTYRQFMM